MSFSSEIKDELLSHYAKARHCNLAELSAFLHMCGDFYVDRRGNGHLKFSSENFSVMRKCFTLMEKTFNIKTEIVIRRNISGNGFNYSLYYKGEEVQAVGHAIVQSMCCKRAYIRGAFIAAGSMSDPRKSYHFEIVCNAEERAKYLKDMIHSFDLEAKIVNRKKAYVVYLKEGSQIVDVLNVMEAHESLMQLENVRILKEMRNSVNRKVNCETANINKTVSASRRQIEDIMYIRDTVGIDVLPEGLRDVALTRLAHPEEPLKELANLLDTPIGKSGVNHRLRKLSEMAEKLRDSREEDIL